MSRFPKLTETFVLNEILEVQRQGVAVSIYPLVRGRDRVTQPGAAELAARAHYLPFLAPSFLASHVHFLRHRPRAYLSSLVHLIRDNLGKPRFLAAGLYLFPKAVHAARLMANSGVQHVHCHFARHPALAGYIIGRLTGIPYSFTAHGSDVHVDRRMLCRKLREAAFAITISEFNRAVIEADCGAMTNGKLRVLHVGIATDVFHPDAERSRVPSNRLRVVCVGTLHEVKGQVHLVEACAQLRNLGVDVTCRLIGQGPDEASLRHAIERLGLQDRVALCGPLPHDRVIEELREADALVAPSVVSARGQREGIPVVLMEAMSSGLPVVASRLSGIPELVDDERNGLLVEPGRAEDIARALARLVSQPELRQRLGKEGRRTIEREFDLRVNAARLVAMFEAAAAP